MSIYKSSVNKPITTFMIFTAIVVIGLFSLSKVPIDLYPEIEPPYISVMTTYAGASAAEIETTITQIIEDALNSVDKLKKISSTSSDNMSIINLEFEWGTNLDETTNNIRDVLDRIKKFLPEEAENPAIFKFSTNMMPIVFYAVTANESYNGIEKILDEKIINPLNRIDGIGSVGVMGVPKRVIYVDVDPQRLDAHNITIEQIAQVIKTENLSMPSGNIKMGDTDYQLSVNSEFTSSDEIKNLIISNIQGKTIYLSDVAKVEDRIKDSSIDEKINGKDGVRMFIMKQSGANSVKVANNVNKMLDNLKKELPPDVKIQLIMDTSTFIKNSISNLSETLLWAFFFVVLVVIFFLGRWRATFIIVLSIPISLIVSFIYLYFTGNSINVISLTSLSIAIGMVVDDAIVVLENINKHIERGSSAREAAIYATNEVWLAVIVTTLVIVAVFLPLTLVSGMTGVMFKQLGWIVTITITTSTLVAISLVPLLSSLLLNNNGLKTDRKFSHNNTIVPILNWLDNFYAKTLRWVLCHKKIVIGGGFIVFISSLFLIRFIGTDFMPESDESRLSINIELQTGRRVEFTSQIARRIEKTVKEKYPEVVIMAATSGSDDEGSMFSLFNPTGSNIINIMMRLKLPHERGKTVWQIANEIRSDIALLPEVITFNVSTSGSRGFGGGNNTIDVDVYGYDFNETNYVAEQLKSKFSNIKNATDITVSRKKDKPELQVILDKNILAKHGLNSAYVSSSIRNRVRGLTASFYKEDGEEYNIIVRIEEPFRKSITDLEEFTIVSPTNGAKLKLKELGKIKEFWTPPSIQHKRKERIVTVSAKANGISLGDLAKEINNEIKNVDIPQGVLLQVGGAYEDQQDAFKDLGMLMIISLILVFIAMASQFESFTMPFIIMISIPFAFTGVIFALLITGTTLSMISALGAILLIGIVVKNGIVLIDFTNLMRDRGVELYEAIMISGKSRLRPVLMTALTTMLGMLPLALSKGEGSELWRPMGVSVIGGLLFSTIITMIIVPAMYAIFARKGERNKKDKIRKKFQFLK